ncbi:MAG: delta-60 repeat domain-containing protein, partial [Dolichospermum sp.]
MDTSFNPGTGLNSYGSVYSTSLQTDGKLIIGGYFGSYNGISRGSIARLNMNGTLDSTFNPGSGSDDFVYSTFIQEDGKIVIGGGFYSFNGVESRAIIRVNPNGSLDNSFRSGTGFFGIGNVSVFAMAQVANDKIIVAGEFASYNGSGFKNIAQIHLGSCYAPTVIGSSTICFGGSTTLTSSISTGNVWSNGATTQSITVTEAGSYTVQVVNGSCTTAVSNAINVVLTPALSTPTISGSSTFCLGGSTTLTSSALTGNLWSTGDTTRSITVNTAGDYSVRVVSGGCTSANSNPIVVSVTSPAAPQIAFDSAGNRCLGSEIIVSVAGTYNQYRWNNGATTRSIAVRGTGAFSAEVLDSSGCWSLPSRTASIVFDTTFCQIRIS